MTRPNVDAPAPKPAAGLAGLLSSLLVLSAVFFFINSACSGRSSNGREVCRVSAVAPEGSSIEIVMPADGATVSSARAGLVPVRVELAAEGVKVQPAFVCKQATGHFELSVDRIDAPDCGQVPSDHQFRALIRGETTLTLMLAPGPYTLTAEFILGDVSKYDELLDEAHVTVVGVPSDAGAALCR